MLTLTIWVNSILSTQSVIPLSKTSSSILKKNSAKLNVLHLNFKNPFIFVLGVAIFAIEGIVVWHYRQPSLVQFRKVEFWSLFISLLFLAIIYFYKGVRNKTNKIQLFAFSGIFSLLFSSVTAKELTFYLQKMSVVHAESQELRSYGSHFIVGFNDWDEVGKLAREGAIAGIFITQKNVAGKSVDQIRAEINELQRLRITNLLPPLIIATDQEGGVVSKLSPPLEFQPALNTIVKPTSDQLTAEEIEQVKGYAQKQAQGLASLGVTHNFSPVIDLKPTVIAKNDQFTRIGLRTLGSTPAQVSEIAKIYSQTLKEHGITPTFKHFPGLSKVTTDTHVKSATLNTPLSELMNADLVPFKTLGQNPDSLLMLSHVILTDVDPKHPVSFSKIVIQDLLKKQLQIKSKLITDDFSMGAVVDSPEGVNSAVDLALEAGVDYILIAYDPDLYYKAMEHLLKK